MALSISYTSGNAVLGNKLTVALPDGNPGSYFKIEREDVAGHYSLVAVRGYDTVANSSIVAPGGGSFDIFDFEAPINKSLKYHVSTGVLPDATSTGTADTGTLAGTAFPTGFTVITNPLDETVIVAGNVSDLTEWSYGSNVLGSHRVLGRKNPVVATDVMSGRTGGMSLTNLNVFSVDYDGDGAHTQYAPFVGDWDTIFTNGDVLYFRNDYTISGFDDLYFVANNLALSRISGPVGQSAVIRQFDIDYTEVDRPADVGTAFTKFTWQVIADSNPTWADVTVTHADWADVLLNPTA